MSLVRNVDLEGVHTTSNKGAEAILLFVHSLQDLDAQSAPVIELAPVDALAWNAYPKTQQLSGE